MQELKDATGQHLVRSSRTSHEFLHRSRTVCLHGPIPRFWMTDLSCGPAIVAIGVVDAGSWLTLGPDRLLCGGGRRRSHQDRGLIEFSDCPGAASRLHIGEPTALAAAREG